jgi:outer membrane protein assembly factor BamB
LAAASVVAALALAAILAVVVPDDSDQAPTDVSLPTIESLPTEPTPVELSPTTYGGAALDTTPIPIAGRNPYRVAVGRDVWTMSLDGQVERRDPTTLDITAELALADSSLIAADAEALWVADAVTGRVLRIDPDTTEVVADIQTGIVVDERVFRSGGLGMQFGPTRQFARIGGIDASDGSVWVGDQDGRVLRIDPRRNAVVDTFDVGIRADLVRADSGFVAVVDREAGHVVVVDGATGDELFSTDVGGLAGADVHGGAVYVLDPDAGVVTRTDLSSFVEVRSEPLGPLANIEGNPLYSPVIAVDDAGVLATSESGLHVLDAATLAEVARFDVDTRAGEMLIAPDGTAWIVQFYGSTLSRLAPLPR